MARKTKIVVKDNAASGIKTEEQVFKGFDPTRTKDSASPAVAQDNATPEVPKVDVAALVKDAVEAAMAKSEEAKQAEADALKAELDAAIAEQEAKAKAEADALKAELDKEKEANSKLEDLFKLAGNQNGVTAQEANSSPQFSAMNTILKPSREAQGILAEYLQEVDSVEKVQIADSNGVRMSRNFETTDGLLRELRRDSRQWRQFMQSMEAYAKGHGMLRGRKSVSKDAATVKTDVPPAFLDTLSAIMRTNNRAGFIFHQFTNTRVDFNQGMGDTIQIPRAAFLPAPADPDARKLSGAGTFARINSTNQRLQAGFVRAVVEEWGLGKDSSNPPVGIPTFVQAYSMLDLQQILEGNLFFDYIQWEDLKIRSLWAPTSRVVYQDTNNRVSTTAANGAGTFNRAFFNQLYSYMRTLLIPTYRDNCYGFVLTTQAAADFKESLSSDWEAPTVEDLAALSNMMDPAAGGETDRVTGYIGKFENFHFFETNAYGIGAAGTEGVQTETVAAGSATTRSNYAFGANTIGRGVAQPFEIRRRNDDDYGRSNEYIWLSYEGFVAMDVDPTGYSDTSDVPQQLRVLDVRSIG